MSLSPANPENDIDRPRSLRSRWLLLLAAVLAIALAIFGPGFYSQIKRYVFEKRADDAIAKGDDEKAIWQLHMILQQFPDDIEALRKLVELGEKQRAPWVLQVKRRIFDLNPGDPATALDLAEEACRDNQPELARLALQNYGESKDPSIAAKAQNILGMIAVQEGNRAVAMGCFQKAHELKPQSDAIAKNYAAFLLSDPGNDHMETIRGLIEKLKQEPATRLAADRLQIALELRNNDVEAARALANSIVEQPGHLFADDLQRVAILALANIDEAGRALDDLCQKVPQEHALELLLWLHQNGHDQRSLELIKRLPKSLRGYQVVRVIEAETLLRLKEYDTALALLENSAWGESDPLRLALLANLYHLRGETEKAAEMRGAAVTKVLASQEILPVAGPLLLNYITRIKEWEGEREKLLWGMADSPYLADDALRSLARFYEKRNDARGLARVFLKLTNRHPGEKAYLNNAVSLSLLTGVNRQWAIENAESLFQKYPDDPVIQSTYAYALALANRPSEAYGMVAKIDEELLRTPAFALYHAYVLNANGRTDEARQAVRQIDSAKLLDMERELLQEINRE